MNEAANKGGMIIFTFSMIFTLIFFGYVMVYQPGPIDTEKKLAPGLTKAGLLNQKLEWSQSTPEKIEIGKNLFEVNFAFQTNLQQLVERLNNGDLKNETSEIRLFNLVTNGFDNPTRNKNGHIPELERWQIALYLKSLVKSPQAMDQTEWNNYLKYGL